MSTGWSEIEDRARYAAAAPVIAAASAWIALGCGDGAAAAAALGTAPERTLLVDGDPVALRAAARAFPSARTLEADLGGPAGAARVREAVAELGDAAVTCFGVLDRLASFVPLLDLLGELVERQGATVVLDVPNDVAEGRPRPGDRIVWGERAFDELRRLLPGEPVLARQVAVAGSAVVRDGGGDEPLDLPAVRPASETPTHLLAAFGPWAGRLAAAAFAAPMDRAVERRREREREADVAFLEARLAQLER